MEIIKKRWYYLLLGLLFYACERPKPQKVFTGEKQFRTTDPSRLYFNNIRSSNYYKKRIPNTKVDTYRHRKFSYTDKRPILYATIINRWMEEEAYVFIEKNDYPAFTDSLVIQWKKDSLAGEYVLDRFTKENQFEFAGRLYESIAQKQKLQLLLSNDETTPIFTEIKDQQAFLATMRDYYELIEVED